VLQVGLGIGIAKTSRLTGLGTGMVHRLKRETDRGLPRQEHGGALSVGSSITDGLAAAPKRVGRVPMDEIATAIARGVGMLADSVATG